MVFFWLIGQAFTFLLIVAGVLMLIGGIAAHPLVFVVYLLSGLSIALIVLALAMPGKAKS